MDALTTQQIVIRNYLAQDRPILRRLYLDTRRQAFIWLDHALFTLADFDADTRGERIWIAECDGDVAGFASAWLPHNFLHALYVDSAFQRRGVGSALLQAVSDELDHPVSLKCMTRNRRALAFYHANGWYIAAAESDKDGDYYLMKSD